jgi:hypothetical protein
VARLGWLWGAFSLSECVVMRVGKCNALVEGIERLGMGEGTGKERNRARV